MASDQDSLATTADNALEFNKRFIEGCSARVKRLEDKNRQLEEENQQLKEDNKALRLRLGLSPAHVSSTQAPASQALPNPGGLDSSPSDPKSASDCTRDLFPGRAPSHRRESSVDSVPSVGQDLPDERESSPFSQREQPTVDAPNSDLLAGLSAFTHDPATDKDFTYKPSPGSPVLPSNLTGISSASRKRKISPSPSPEPPTSPTKKPKCRNCLHEGKICSVEPICSECSVSYAHCLYTRCKYDENCTRGDCTFIHSDQFDENTGEWDVKERQSRGPVAKKTRV